MKPFCFFLITICVCGVFKLGVALKCYECNGIEATTKLKNCKNRNNWVVHECRSEKNEDVCAAIWGSFESAGSEQMEMRQCYTREKDEKNSACFQKYSEVKIPAQPGSIDDKPKVIKFNYTICLCPTDLCNDMWNDIAFYKEGNPWIYPDISTQTPTIEEEKPVAKSCVLTASSVLVFATWLMHSVIFSLFR